MYACVLGGWGGADLSGVNLGLVEEGLLGEVDEVVLCVLPLHDGTAVGCRELTLLFVSSGDQLGVLVLQSGERYSNTALTNPEESSMNKANRLSFPVL